MGGQTEANQQAVSPIERALGSDFYDLHPAVRRHYSAQAVEIAGTMDSVYVKSAVKPFALVSYKLLHAPVPHGGRNVRISLHNRIDDSGAVHWVRMFFGNDTFPREITFASHMVHSNDHRIIEFSRYGVGVETDLSVDAHGSLVYEMRRYVVRVPVLGLAVRFPTWLIPVWRRSHPGNRRVRRKSKDSSLNDGREGK